MEVGVREFKAKLSNYLARAAAGEVLTVTDRGQPVAVLSPPPAPSTWMRRPPWAGSLEPRGDRCIRCAGSLQPAACSAPSPRTAAIHARTVTTYVDSSALLKRYVEDPDSSRADELLADDALATARHTLVKVRQNLARLLPAPAAAQARAAFAGDLAALSLIELDAATTELAAVFAEQTGVRTLDALHLGAAYRIGTAVTFLTFDVRQGVAARQLGFHVVGI